MSLIQTASTIAGLGLQNVGTRQISQAHAAGGGPAVGRTRRALFWGAFVLAILGAVLFWFLSPWLAAVVLDDPARADDVAWLSLGVALTVGAGSQGALLTGMRRIGDLARINLGAGLSGAVFGVAALWAWGEKGLLVMILVAPMTSFLLGHFYVMRLGPPVGPRSSIPDLGKEWHEMLALGLTFMLSGLVITLGHLLVRGIIQNDMGAVSLGHFQAAWTIGMTYLGIVLGAMATDYYPRLAAIITNPQAVTQLVNEQTEVTLLLCAPVLLALLGLAPWVIGLLYTAEFAPAVEVLRWQLLGDIFKLMTWPMGFVILASGDGRNFLMTEALGVGVLVVGVFVGLPIMGIAASGVAFLLMYLVSLPLVFYLVRRRLEFAWSVTVKRLGVIIIMAATLVEVAAGWSDMLGAIVGVFSAGGMGLWALLRLSEMTQVSGKFAYVAHLGLRLRAWSRNR